MNIKDSDKEYMMQAKIKALAFLNKTELKPEDARKAINSIVKDICTYPAFDKSFTDSVVKMGQYMLNKYHYIDYREIKEFILGFNFEPNLSK